MKQTTTAYDQKRQTRTGFDAIAPTYDTIRFVQACAARLVALAPLRKGARVLDVATGTGLAALAAARVVGPTGAVTGVDIAPAMLALARAKLAASGLTHLALQEGDAERLEFSERSFDVVLCASSLFFVPDMAAAVREWHRVLVPDGCAAFSAFGPSFLQPLRELWGARLQAHGVTPPAPPVHRLADPAACRELLEAAGFRHVEVHAEQHGYYLRDAQDRWDEISASLEGLPLQRLTTAQRERIRAEHLTELHALTTSRGIWVDVPAHFVLGRS